MTPTPVPVFDGHNDTLTQLHHASGEDARSFFERSDRGHIDLPRAREGGLVGGFFAIFTRSPDYDRVVGPLLDERGAEVEGGWSVELPPRLRRRAALTFTIRIMSALHCLIERSEGAVRLVRSSAELGRCIEHGTLAVVLHFEGVEAIDTRLEALDVFYDAGLRSLGPVWSRPNAFAHGVPFDFPRTPDTGPGLTAAGGRLVRRCNELGVLVDLSHMNERGFWDVADLTDAPLVATHSNAHALCPSPRNLTDAQIDEVGRTGGIIGLNFHVGFLREDGRTEVDTPLSTIVAHARHIADRVGPEHLGLGSDFDGATMPAPLGDVAGLPALLDALRAGGFSESEVRAIALDNWLRVLEATWGA